MNSATCIRFIIISILCFVMLLISGEGVAGDNEPQSLASLTYITEEYYPFNYAKDGALQGISIDLIHAAWERLGVAKQPIRLLPWARGYDAVLNEPGTVLFSMARTESREHLFRWAGPIAKARFVLIGLKKRQLQIADEQALERYVIGTVIKDISDVLLESYKDRVRVEPVASMDYNIKKLLAGRVDLVAYEEGSMSRFVSTHGLSPDMFESVFVLEETECYYAFHPTTPKAIVQKLQSALNEIRSEQMYQDILARHLP